MKWSSIFTCLYYTYVIFKIVQYLCINRENCLTRHNQPFLRVGSFYEQKMIICWLMFIIKGLFCAKQAKQYLNPYTNVFCCSWGIQWWRHRSNCKLRELFLSTKWSSIMIISKTNLHSLWWAKQKRLAIRSIERNPPHKSNKLFPWRANLERRMIIFWQVAVKKWLFW